MPKATLTDRFWSKVDKAGPIPIGTPAVGPCWVWTGATNPAGYGNFYRERRYINAHVVAWELEFGPVPKGMRVDHRCYVSGCVRASHLRLLTNRQNCENWHGPRPGSKSRHRGVSWHEGRQQWQVRVFSGGVCHWGGSFPPEQEDQAGEVAREIRLRVMTHSDMDRLP